LSRRTSIWRLSSCDGRVFTIGDAPAVVGVAPPQAVADGNDALFGAVCLHVFEAGWVKLD